jgi:hypothetical protein
LILVLQNFCFAEMNLGLFWFSEAGLVLALFWLVAGQWPGSGLMAQGWPGAFWPRSASAFHFIGWLMIWQLWLGHEFMEMVNGF